MPPGTVGMAPSLSLDYSSQSGMGLLGQGWGIGGLSSITRCPKTIVQDGVRRGISLTAEDQFCLDGQRLLLVTGVHGGNAEYRTQIDSFSRVKSYGSDPAKGPDYWEVETKGAGPILTFGNTADSTIEAQGKTQVLTWAVSRARDRRGNYYTVHYTESNTTSSNTTSLGEFYPSRIRYTGNDTTGLVAYNAVNFVYESRPDLSLGFVTGSRVTQTQRLTAIQTRINTAADGTLGALVRDFRVAYTTNAINGRSRVQTVSDCDATGTCLTPTQFSWTERDVAANTFSAANSGNWGGPAVAFQSETLHGTKAQQVKTQVIMGDFDGDGATDLARGDGTTAWQVCLARGTSFLCQTWTGPASLTRDTVSGDFNGDGRTDIAVYPKTDGPGTWNVCLSNGTAFSCSGWAGQGATNFIGNGEVNGALVGDFNGDGRDDIAVASNNLGTEYLCRSTGSGFLSGGCQTYPGSWLFMYYAPSGTEGTIVSFARNQSGGDLDGDGRTDYVQLIGFREDQNTYPPASWSGIRAGDTGFTVFGTPATGKLLLDIESGPGESHFVDFNADPMLSFSDLITGFNAITPDVPKAEICRSDGTALLTCINVTGVTSSNYGIRHIGDADGDGRPDAYIQWGVCQIGLATLGADNADQYDYTCTTWTAPTVPANSRATFRGDFNGDGRIDTAGYVEVTSTTGYWYVNLAGHGGFPDLLKSVTNGAGHVTEFDYKGLHDSSVYTKGSTVPTYPTVNVNSAAPVVSQMRVANALGGWLATSYKYEGQRADLTGRGALGFEKVRTIDQVNNITTEVTSNQTFPTTGLPTEVRATQGDVETGTVLKLTVNTLASFTTSGGAAFPYISASSTTPKDLNGAALPIVDTTIGSNIDAYGNVLNNTEVVSAGGETFTTTTTSTYDNLTTNWLIGLLRTRTTTKSTSQTGTTTSAPSLSLTACTSTTPTISPTSATMTCTVGNSGQAVATSIVYGAPADTTASGPTSCGANTANCGSVTVTTATAAGTRTGTLSATPSPAGAAGSASVNLTVDANAPVLSLTGCSSTTPTTSPTAASMTCTLANTGPAAATAIAYAGPAGTTRNGPASCAANAANCGTVTLTTGSASGTYAGALTATPTPAGTVASVAANLVVNPSAPALTISGCTATTPTTSPTAATLSCTLGNTGQTTAASIAYASPAGTTPSGPANCAGSTANCGTVTVTTGTSAATYAGTLGATPTPSGSAASTPVNLVVNPTPPALTLSGCSSTTPTTSPTAATMSCTLGNTGQTAATSIAYAAPGSTTPSGPASCAASTASCGTVTVTTGTSPAAYSGTLTATPTPSGSAGTASVSLTVNPTPPALTLSACSSTTPTTSPTAATMTCTLGNTGQTAASSISYSAPGSTSPSGPASCAANTANCGAVTVTSGTSPATYAGALSATPNPSGSAASASVNLTVNPTPPSLTLSACSSTTPTTTPTAATMSCTLGNAGQTTATSISYSAPGSTTPGGPASCAANTANCGTVTVTTSTSPGTYAGTLSATPTPGGGAGSASVNLTVNNTPPALSFTGCGGGTSTAPTPAQHTCTLRNNGGTNASSVSYSTTVPGASVSGPTTCAGFSTNCGTVTVQSSATAGTYSGTATATPNAGTGVTSAQITLTVNPAVTTTTITASPTSLAFGTISKDTMSTIKTVTVSNTGTLAATITWPTAYTGGTANQGSYTTTGLAGATCTSGGSLAAGASCVIAVRYNAGCTGGSRNGRIDIQGSNFTTVPVTLTATTSSSGVCN